MRWFIRILATTATLLSLTLCTAMTALWLRGRTVADQIEFGYFDHRPHPGYPSIQDASVLRAHHSAGRTTVSVVHCPCVGRPTGTPPGPGARAAVSEHFDGPRRSTPRWTYGRLTPAGLAYAESVAWRNEYQTTRHDVASVRTQSNRLARTVSFPDWLPAGVFALLPLSHLARFVLRRNRSTNNQCAACGYDLRATPHRCPECGTIAGPTPGPA
jgi:hypothetical protein